MNSKREDITTRADVEKLLTDFYAAAVSDEQIGRHFADLDLENHLPVIVGFWEKILFGTPAYFGNPAEVHRRLNEKDRLTLNDFQRWVKIFEQKVDENFVGKTAENAKLRAKMIAHGLHQNLKGGVL